MNIPMTVSHPAGDTRSRRLSPQQLYALGLLRDYGDDDGWGIVCSQGSHAHPCEDRGDGAWLAAWINHRTADALEARGLLEIRREVGCFITCRFTNAGYERMRDQ